MEYTDYSRHGERGQQTHQELPQQRSSGSIPTTNFRTMGDAFHLQQSPAVSVSATSPDLFYQHLQLHPVNVQNGPPDTNHYHQQGQGNGHQAMTHLPYMPSAMGAPRGVGGVPIAPRPPSGITQQPQCFTTPQGSTSTCTGDGQRDAPLLLQCDEVHHGTGESSGQELDTLFGSVMQAGLDTSPTQRPDGQPMPSSTSESSNNSTKGDANLQAHASPSSKEQEQQSTERQLTVPTEVENNIGELDGVPAHLLPGQKLKAFIHVPLPEGLAYDFADPRGKSVRGVVTSRVVEKGEIFGPFRGALLEDEGGRQIGSTWELCLLGDIWFYIDGSNKIHKNWLHHVNQARTREEQNLETFQSYGDIYFRAIETIKPCTELRVFYSKEYREKIGYSASLDELNYDKTADKFVCSECHATFHMAKSILRHIKFSHPRNKTTTKKKIPSNLHFGLRAQVRARATEDSWPQEAKGTESPVFNEMVMEMQTSSRQDDAVLATTSSNCQDKDDHVEASHLASLEVSAGMRDEHFVCVTCGKGFTTQGRLIAHELFHEITSEKYRCDICSYVCGTKHSMMRHRVLHLNRKYQCSHCFHSYNIKHHLKRHALVKHCFNIHTGQFHCKGCSKTFKENDAFSRHSGNCQPHRKRQHGGEEEDSESHEHPAPEQGRKDKSFQSFKKSDAFSRHSGNCQPHRKRQQDGEEEDSESHDEHPEPKQGRKDKSFKKSDPFSRHSRNWQPLRKRRQGLEEEDSESHEHPVPKQGKKDESIKSLKKSDVFSRHSENWRPHRKRRQGGEEKDSDSHDEHPAPEQGRKDKSIQQEPGASEAPSGVSKYEEISGKPDMLGVHRDSDLSKPYRCRICRTHFKTASSRDLHQRNSHKTRKMFPCEQCQKVFHSQWCLVRHTRVHSRDLRYKCGQCTRSFGSERALKNHHVEHTEARPYRCEPCQKAFRTPKRLYAHKHRIHSGIERRFKCSYCDKRFYDRTGVEHHERRHKGIRPFVCLTCGKAFSSKHSLGCHEKVHTGEKAFKCHICEKTFTLNQNLDMHLLHNHGV